MLRYASTLCIILSGILLTGCSSQIVINGRVAQAAAPYDASSRDKLVYLAKLEKNAEGITPLEVDLPPGIDPASLQEKDNADEKISLSLNQAIENVISKTFLPVETVEADVDLDLGLSIKAQLHYARGKSAFIDGKYYLAIQELEQALAVDQNNPTILRQLARAYAAIDNGPRSAALFQQLLWNDPSDSEAAFAVGWNTVRQRRYDESIATIGLVLLKDDGFTHDPSANLIANHMLTVSLRYLGYDKASIEAQTLVLNNLKTTSTSSIYRVQIESIERQQPELWREIGDANCRLGNYAQAADAYGKSMAFPTVDELGAYPRIIYVYLKLGWVYSAQLACLEAMDVSAGSIDDRLIKLAGYLQNQSENVVLLGEAARELQQSWPLSTGLARIAAALLPLDEGITALKDVVDRNPSDMEAVGQLLHWLYDEDAEKTTRLAIALVESNPDYAAEIADHLYQIAGISNDILLVLQNNNSAASAFILARIWTRASSSAEAWYAIEKGLLRSQDSTLLLKARTQVAADMGEVELLEWSIEKIKPIDDIDKWLLISKVYRKVERWKAAIDAAEKALELDENNITAWTELAYAQSVNTELASLARDSAEHAVRLDSHNNEAYHILLKLHGRGGYLEDATSLNRVVQYIVNNNPHSMVLSLIDADRLAAQRDFQRAISKLTTVYESNREAESVLNALVTNWIRSDRTEAAKIWLESNLRERPDDPALIRQFVRVLMEMDNFFEAEELLRRRLDENEYDPIGLQLIEVVLRATNRLEEALDIAERRLRRRPDGGMKSLELASLYISAGNTKKAIAALLPLKDRFESLPTEFAQGLLRTVIRLNDTDHIAARLRLSVVDKFLSRFSDAPMSVYGVGLVTLAMLGEPESSFDAFAYRAFENASSTSTQDRQNNLVMGVRDTAQVLFREGYPALAGRLAKLRLESEPVLEPAFVVILGQIAQAAFVAADQVDNARKIIRLMKQNEQFAGYSEADAIFNLSTLCTIIEKEQLADELLQEALKLNPDNAMAMNNLGYKWIEEGRSDNAAINLVEKAFKLNPEDSNILDTIGWLRYKQGRFDSNALENTPGALELINNAMQVVRLRRNGEPGEPSAEMFDHLGDTLWRLRDKEGAINAWQKAVKKLEDPSFRSSTIDGLWGYLNNNWRIVVINPEKNFENIYGKIRDSTRSKLQKAEAGEEPILAPTFEEMQSSFNKGD